MDHLIVIKSTFGPSAYIYNGGLNVRLKNSVFWVEFVIVSSPKHIRQNLISFICQIIPLTIEPRLQSQYILQTQHIINICSNLKLCIYYFWKISMLIIIEKNLKHSPWIIIMMILEISHHFINGRSIYLIISNELFLSIKLKGLDIY